MGFELTKAPLLHVDMTPDDGFVLRILRAYRQRAECDWVKTGDGHPVHEAMNEANRKRRKLLDAALEALGGE